MIRQSVLTAVIVTAYQVIADPIPITFNVSPIGIRPRHWDMSITVDTQPASTILVSPLNSGN